MINLFSGLPKEAYKKYIIIKEYQKDQLIYNEGDECEYLGLVLKGKIAVSTLTYCDKEYQITHLEENDIFGDSLLFGNEHNFFGDLIAIEEAKVAFIHKNSLLELLENKIFLCNYLTIQACNKQKLQDRIKLLSQKNIEDKIMFYLQEEKRKNHSNTILIKSKEQLARNLNIPRPSLSRSLSFLQNKGLIKFNRKKITLVV